MRVPLVVVLAGLMLAGCGKSENSDAKPTSVTPTAAGSITAVQPTPSDHEAVKVGADSAGKQVDLAIGQGLIVTLAANPTTGYAWVVSGLDQNVLRQNGSAEYEQDPNPDGMVGVGGKSVLNFVGANPGTTQLVLDYERAWEQGVEPAQKFTLNLTVR